MNFDELRKNKKTTIISTEESLKDVEPFYTFKELIEFIDTAPIEYITKLLESYGIEFEDNNDNEDDNE